MSNQERESMSWKKVMNKGNGVIFTRENMTVYILDISDVLILSPLLSLFLLEELA